MRSRYGGRRSDWERWWGTPVSPGVYSRPLTRGDLVIPVALFVGLPLAAVVVSLAPWVMALPAVLLVGAVVGYPLYQLTAGLLLEILRPAGVWVLTPRRVLRAAGWIAAWAALAGFWAIVYGPR